MFDKYVIQSGDTLPIIADRFKTTAQNILDINNIAYPDMIRAGMEIIVPKNVQEYFTTYTINQGDNLYAIAKRYNINPTLLAAVNGLSDVDYIYPNQQLLIPKSGYSYYITTDGDTLSLVADKFNTKPENVIATNTIYLLPGQLIVNKKV
jgi:LysM repeat protein